jgi:arylsulfatase A
MSDFLPTICEAAEIALPEGMPIDGRSFLPQLLGKPGNPREWVYCWFSRSGERGKARIFARTKRYKLYSTGEFYDIEQDRLESSPIPADSLSNNIRGEYELLLGVLANFSDARPAHLK